MRALPMPNFINSFPVAKCTYKGVCLHLRLPLAPRTTMQDVMHEHVALCTEIVQTVRASVPPQWANPIRPGVHSCASSRISRA